MPYSIGTDIGGTFTDCAVVDGDGRVVTGKAPSTPEDFSRGFFDAIGSAADTLGVAPRELLREAEVVVHATTAGTNAVVQRQGVRVGLITTRGHAKAILLMRGAGRTKGLEVEELLDIPSTYRPEPIVPRGLIREVTERVDCFGQVVVGLDEDEVRTATEELLAAGAKAIAISFLWCFANPAHELRAKEIVERAAPGVFVSCGHAVAARLGEYYRTVGVVMNSYIGPLMRSYTGRIVDGVKDAGYERPTLFAQCLGGSASHETITRVPLYTLDSGPVSGIVACVHLAERFGHENVIAADMGGTTFDVSVIPGRAPQRRDSAVINKYELYLPTIDVESIGAGGGSIAWIDPSSSTMKVGPRSAGADPGPMCYGHGGSEPTVTDADVALGIVNPDTFLGGRHALDRDRAVAGVAALGAQIGLSVEEAAAGILDIIDHTMAEKMRRMTVFRGHDPREFVVYAFGGAGPMHAGGFSRELGASTVVIPLGDTASVLSALGTVSSDVVHALDATLVMSAPFDMAALDATFEELADRARTQLRTEGFSGARVAFARHVSMKYGAQVYDLAVGLQSGDTSEQLVARFESEYAERYGRDAGYAPAGVQIIGARLEARGLLPRPAIALRNGAAPQRPRVGSRPVWWREAGGWIDTPAWSQLEGAATGTRIEGPAVIDLPGTTIPVRPDELVEIDGFGNLLLSLG